MEPKSYEEMALDALADGKHQEALVLAILSLREPVVLEAPDEEPEPAGVVTVRGVESFGRL